MFWVRKLDSKKKSTKNDCQKAYNKNKNAKNTKSKGMSFSNKTRLSGIFVFFFHSFEKSLKWVILNQFYFYLGLIWAKRVSPYTKKFQNKNPNIVFNSQPFLRVCPLWVYSLIPHVFQHLVRCRITSFPLFLSRKMILSSYTPWDTDHENMVITKK